jgi:hypothetical protein
MGLKYKMICHFKLAADMSGVASGMLAESSSGYLRYCDVYR